MTGLENLLIAYNDSTASDNAHGILRNLLLHARKISTCNIYELAELCYTSAPTLSRLIRKLGYSRYAAFQHAVASCALSYEHHNRLLPKADSYRNGDPVSAFLDAYTMEYRSRYLDGTFIDSIISSS